MQLINALVTSPDDLDFRIHLRNEFLRCGLKKILPVSHQAPPHSTRFNYSTYMGVSQYSWLECMLVK